MKNCGVCVSAVTLMSALASIATPAHAQTTVTFVHVNDLHAHLTDHLDLVRSDETGEKVLARRGGFARIATIIGNIKSENPNTVTMNIGDTFHGGVEGVYTSGDAIAAPLNAMGFDVGVPGNWDFAFGPQVSRDRFGPNGGFLYEGPDFPYLAGNCTFTTPVFLAGQPLAPATMMLNRGGVRVGLIGITSDIVERMHPTLATGLSFLQGEQEYLSYVQTHAQDLRNAGADIVCVLSELGIQKDARLADIVAPGLVDVFFAAHTHELTSEPIVSASGALVVEAGNDGWVGRMDAVVSPGSPTEFGWSLIPVDSSVPEHPGVRALVEAARAPFFDPNVNLAVPIPNVDLPLRMPIDTVIGSVDRLTDRRDVLESSFNNAFTDALRDLSGADVGMTPGFRFVSILAPTEEQLEIESEDELVLDGQITIEDVYRIFPVPYNIVTGSTDADHLRGIMESNMHAVLATDVFDQSGGWFDGFSGVRAVVDAGGDEGKRVHRLHDADSGALWGDAQSLSVCGCQRPIDDPDVICSYPGFQNVQQLINPSTGAAWTPHAVLIDAIQSGGWAPSDRRDIIDLGEIARWPATEYVQAVRGEQSEGCPGDLDMDFVSNIEDLYYVHQNAVDANRDGVINQEDRECLELWLRRNEYEDMSNGR